MAEDMEREAQKNTTDAAGTARFSETQWSPVWVFVLLIPAGVIAFWLALTGVIKEQNPAFLLPFLALALTVNLLCVKTRADEKWLTITFGALFPLYVRRIRLDGIASAESVSYNPLAEFGGWGIRGVAGNQCLNARGNLGVRMVLAGGEKLLIGSETPDALAAALLPLS